MNSEKLRELITNTSKRSRKYILYVIFVFMVVNAIISLGYWPTPVQAQDYVSNDWKVTTVGQVRQLILNRGRLKVWGSDYPGLMATEFPPNSEIRYTSHAGIWIGGLLADEPRVSTGISFTAADEFWPTEAPWDTIWVVNKGDTVDLPYWENYVPVSDQDFVCTYNDYEVLFPTVGSVGGGEEHNPLYLDVIQTVYSWGSPPLDQIVMWNYYIIPTRYNIAELYFSVFNRSRIGQVSSGSAAEVDDQVRYHPKYTMMSFEDKFGGQDEPADGAMGFMFIPPEEYNMDDLLPSFLWARSRTSILATNDKGRYYDMMASRKIMQNQQTADGAIGWLSVGPFDVEVGDTLLLRRAQIMGRDVEELENNAKTVQAVVDRDFKIPTAPPMPPLQVQTRSKEVQLTWEPTTDTNPETYQDPNRGDTLSQPFEGYRIYKSVQSTNGPWKLLADYDVAENGYGPEAGLDCTYTDIGLLNNVQYYYSVTAYSKQDEVLNWPSIESSVYQNAVEVVPGPAMQETVGEVAVVPNPYRGDIRYQDYEPPWEKAPPGRDWMEQDRRLQFINLPPRCEITIYTAVGEYVATLNHNDPDRGYEDWNMTSYVNQAIASGIYLFTVKDLNTGNTQVGKFVVIK